MNTDIWAEFDNGVALKIGKAGKSEGIQNVRREIKEWVKENFLSKRQVEEVIEGELNDEWNGSLEAQDALNRLKSRLNIKGKEI